MKKATPKNIFAVKPASAGEGFLLLMLLNFKLEVVENIVKQLPEINTVSTPQFRFIESVFKDSMDFIYKYSNYLVLSDGEKQTRDSFKNRSIFEFRNDYLISGILFKMKNIVSRLADNFELPKKIEVNMYASVKKQYLDESKNVEKALNFLQKISDQTEVSQFGIELILDGNLLIYKNKHLTLTEKETLLILRLLESGSTTGKRLKDIDRDEANLQKTKNSLNKKIQKKFILKENLIPSGGYFINSIFKISKKS